MDVKEASAMTEASGLVDEQDGIEQTSGAGRRPAAVAFAGCRDALGRPVARDDIKAALQSLFAAFLVGVWFARRR